MKTTTALSIVLGVVLLGLIVWFVTKPEKNTLLNRESVQVSDTSGSQEEESEVPSRSTTNNPQGTSSANYGYGKKIPFSEFMKEGKPYTCRTNQAIENIQTTGTVYLSDQMIRGNFTSFAQGMTINSSLIIRDGYAYIWSGMTPSGFKVATTDPASVKSSTGNSSFSWDADTITDYTCEPWTSVDSSVFTIPTNIEFANIGAR